MHDQNMSREEYKALDPKQHKDYPKEKKICGATYLNLDDVESNIEECKKKYTELSSLSLNKAGGDEAQIEQRKQRYNGVVFVTCKSTIDARKVIGSQTQSTLVWLLNNLLACRQSDKSKTWCF